MTRSTDETWRHLAECAIYLSPAEAFEFDLVNKEMWTIGSKNVVDADGMVAKVPAIEKSSNLPQWRMDECPKGFNDRHCRAFKI
jgi:hypothetical protein